MQNKIYILINKRRAAMNIENPLIYYGIEGFHNISIEKEKILIAPPERCSN